MCFLLYSLGNLSPKYRSQLRNIHLCILAPYRLLKKYSYKDLLRPLIVDLQHLQCVGISITVDQKTFQVYGALATISSDNLSANSLGGFVCNFNNGRI